MEREREWSADPALVAIETGIGERLSESEEASVDLNLEEVRVIMAFLTAVLFEERGVCLSRPPEVRLQWTTKGGIGFKTTVEVAKPLRTRMLLCGCLIDQGKGIPRLKNNRVQISVEGLLAQVATSAMCLKEIIRDVLNDLPKAVRDTLPSRLSRLGYCFGVGRVEVSFENVGGKMVVRVRLERSV